MLCAIPIETTIRELDGVLYQALHLAKRGLPTLIGERVVNQIVENSGKPVIYFNNDHFASIGEAVKKSEGRVVNIHAEGINLVDSPHVTGLFAKSAAQASVLCAWGERQAHLVKSALTEDIVDHVIVTGHPSFDLAHERFCRYYENPEIVERYGRDYILINTNFAYINHMMGLEKYIHMIRKSIEIFNDDDHIRSVRVLAAYQESLMYPFIELAKSLAREFPSKYVIIRPHPVESAEMYVKACSSLPNVVVSKEGSVREWLATSGAVIHHDCTTGIESLFMRKPTIHFRPVFDASIAAHIASLAGVSATTEQEVLDIVRNGEVPKDVVDAQLGSLEPYFANLKQNASEVLAGIAQEYARGVETWMPQPLGVMQDIKVWRKYLSKRLRALQPGHNGRKVKHSLVKFSRLPMSVVKGRLERLRQIESDLPDVNVVRLCLDTFLIVPKNI